MSEIELKDIAAFEIDKVLICKSCLERDDEITEEDIFFYDDLDKDTAYFCDRCKKAISI